MADDTPAQDTQIDRLLKIMSALRTPETGCPWDLEQDFKTIAPYTIEEAYEVFDAIEQNDMDGLCDELGDLLLQVVFHAQMADEMEAFAFEDVVRGISDKMIRRHPHVFGDENTKTPQMVKGMWEDIKAKERRDRNAEGEQEGALTGVPLSLPALLRAHKLQKRAARIGFDWPDAAPVFEKIEEEISELRSAIKLDDPANIAEEMGDLLFAVANLSRHLGIEPETALRAANQKFTQRFEAMEAKGANLPNGFNALNLAEMETLWQAVKEDEKSGS